MPEKPVCCDTKPMPLEMEAGTYWWCSCGRSAHQPFCDGAHKGTGMQPVKFELTESKKVWWCQCKQSGKPPLCDGTHKALPATPPA